METCCDYTDAMSYMEVSTDERRMINRLLKIAEAHPDEVKILARPEENDGCLYVQCPKSYLKISPPTRRTLTDEQREAQRQRLMALRKTS